MKFCLNPEARTSLLSRRRGAVRWLSLLLAICLSAALTGTAAARLVNRKISGSLPHAGDVTIFEISPDGRRAVFVADARVDGTPELFSAPIAGGDRNPLTPPLPVGTAVLGFAIAPDSQRVVYWTGPVAGPANELYMVPIAGGDRVDLMGTLAPGDYVQEVTIAPHSQHVVYQSVRPRVGTAPMHVTVWAVAITGGTPVNLDETDCAPDQLWCEFDVQTIPDGSGVVLVPPSVLMRPLWVVTFTGARIELAERVVGRGGSTIAPDAGHVVYRGDERKLYSVPITGGEEPTWLNDTISIQLVSGLGLQISPDSGHVVYWAQQTLTGPLELFSVPIDGTEPEVCLTTGIIDDGEILDFQITPNSAAVVLRADAEVDERVDLYAVSMNGLQRYRLDTDMIDNGDVSAYAVTPNSLGVVFVADRVTDEVNELYGVFINGAGLRTLSETLPPGGDVFDFQITPNGQSVAYRADQQTDDVVQLYVVPSVGGAAIRLNGALAPNGDVAAFAITPDGTAVVYLADQETDGIDELFATLDLEAFFLPLVVR